MVLNLELVSTKLKVLNKMKKDSQVAIFLLVNLALDDIAQADHQSKLKAKALIEQRQKQLERHDQKRIVNSPVDTSCRLRGWANFS